MSANMMQTGRYVLKRCERCGEEFAVQQFIAWHARFCAECRPKRRAELRKDSFAEFLPAGERRRLAAERRRQSQRREEFFAARDRAFARAGLPIPVITAACDGPRIETRGRCGGSHAGGVDTSPWRRMEFC
ncbi:MAG: hypothetical protein II823_06750 [Kiritimatiellae bacterium]|nr:hypothetical protein [Kiritimatiellia bacterium]